MEKYLTPGQYAQATGRSVGQVTQMLRSGRLAGRKVGNRWQITTTPAETGRNAEAPETGPMTAVPPAAGFTVEEFAAMTYLTESGVENWLKTGRLIGRRDEAGGWRVDAANLERPDIRRLLRKA
jgi:hypothetical protein